MKRWVDRWVDWCVNNNFFEDFYQPQKRFKKLAELLLQKCTYSPFFIFLDKSLCQARLLHKFHKIQPASAYLRESRPWSCWENHLVVRTIANPFWYVSSFDVWFFLRIFNFISSSIQVLLHPSSMVSRNSNKLINPTNHATSCLSNFDSFMVSFHLQVLCGAKTGFSRFTTTRFSMAA